MTNVGIVLQARMGSTRLPGKVMLELAGKPMLERIVDRLRRVENVRVIVATTHLPEDDRITSWATGNGVDVFRGDSADVLDRYHSAMAEHHLDHVVRCTADNPFVDPEMIALVIDAHLREQNDFTHCLTEKGSGLPLGTGSEIFSGNAVERSWREGKLPHHREHVDEYVLESDGGFKTALVCAPAEKTAPELRLTVDTPADFALAKDLYDALWRERTIIRVEEVISYLRARAES